MAEFGAYIDPKKNVPAYKGIDGTIGFPKDAQRALRAFDNPVIKRFMSEHNLVLDKLQLTSFGYLVVHMIDKNKDRSGLSENMRFNLYDYTLQSNTVQEIMAYLRARVTLKQALQNPDVKDLLENHKIDPDRIALIYYGPGYVDVLTKHVARAWFGKVSEKGGIINIDATLSANDMVKGLIKTIPNIIIE